MEQADVAEVEHYYFQQKVDRVKGAFIGSPLAITRIFTSILPVGALFLPLINATFDTPFEAFSGNISVLDIYKNTNAFGTIFGMLTAGGADTFFALSFLFLLLSVVMTVLHFALNTLACSPKGKIRNIIIDIIMFAFSAAAPIMFMLMGQKGTVTGNLMYGAYLYIAAQAVNVIIDIITLVKGIEIHHDQCYVGAIPIEEYFKMVEDGWQQDEIRKEEYKRLQARYDEKVAKLAEEEMKKEKEASENNE